MAKFRSVRRKIKFGQYLDEARNTLESLFEFDTEEECDFFDGQTVTLGNNMDARTAKSFKQALASSRIITYLIEADGMTEEEDTQTQRGEQRRKKTEHRVRIRSAAIIPDRREVLERRG